MKTKNHKSDNFVRLGNQNRCKIKTTGRIAVCMAFLNVAAASLHAGQPKLTIGIMVDGLKQETLDMLKPYLSDRGFNRFLDRGIVYDNVEYGTNLDATAAATMLLTGASPKVSGVSSEFVYDADARRVVPIFSTAANGGKGSSASTEQFNPDALKVTTLSDEGRISGAGVTYVYAIAPDASRAMVLGSHAANSAIWFNRKNGSWVTSGHYGEMPYVAANANRSPRLSTRIDTMQWMPSHITTKAAPLAEHLTRYPFRYGFAGSVDNKFDRFADSPLLNREITRLASDYVKSLELGKHDGTDFINVAYTLKPYKWSKTPENRYELYDAYVKLDNDLANLFDVIDATVGKDNVVIFLSGSPETPQRRKDDPKWKIPGGEFSARKAVSLLNLYLIALHGNGDWVKAFHDGHFYLNDDLANKNNKDIGELRRQTSEFLTRMAGVGHAYTIDDIMAARPIVPNAEGQSRNTVIEHSGDVVIDLIPGWSMIDDFNTSGKADEKTYSIAPTTASFMIWAPNVESKRIDTPVDARAIAPALANMLHIRSPNGAGTPPLTIPVKGK